MVKKACKVVNKTGFHMRPANEFANAMSVFSSDVTILFKDKEVNGKSLMNIIAAGIVGGSEIEIKCEGNDEEKALEKAVEIVASGFGEI